MSVELPVRSVTPDEAPIRRRFIPPDRGVLILGAIWFVVVVLAVRWLDRLGEGRTFFFDEWGFVVGRWRLGPDTFLAAHNGHLSIVPASVFYALFETVGLDNYRIFRLTGILVHISVATAVMLYVRRRLDSFAGIGAGIAVLLLGTGWQNVLWPFQIGFMGSVLGFLVALLLLERRSSRADLGASLCVALALACSGVGVAAAGAVLVETVLTRPWRRWWIALGPLAVYLIWYVGYGVSQADTANLDAIPNYVSSSGSSAIAGLYDLSLDWGRVGFGVLLGLLVANVLHRRGTSARVLALLAMLASFWSLTALSRGQLGEPGASRYVYVGAVVVVLLIAELVPTRAARTVAFAGLALGLVSAWSTADIMRAGAGGLRLEGELISAELAVVEELRDQAPTDFEIDSVHAPGLLAGEYLDAVDGIGSSPALPVSAIGQLSEVARLGADRVLFQLAPPEVSSDESSPAACKPEDFVFLDSETTVDPGTVAVVQATDPATLIAVGRWAPPSFPVEIGDQVTIISFGDDGAFGAPWTLRSDSPSARLCLVG